MRAVLETESCVAVGFRLGVTELMPTVREAEEFSHLGPDVLGPDWNAGEALRRLRADPGREIGAALIDQTIMAGPGNVYKCEVCFLAGVDPWGPVEGVKDPEALIHLMKRLMEANRTTGNQVTTGNGRPGLERWVYRRAGQPCRRCGTLIRRRGEGNRDDDRVTYWCPGCQPAITSP